MQKDPRAFLQLAEEHRRMGRFKEAIAVCLEGLGQHPNLHAASITLGRSYLEAGKFDDARATLEGVCARLPEHHLAAKLLAETQCRLGDFTGASATCRAILVHYPRDREFEAMLAEIAAEQEKPAPAPIPAASGAAPPPAPAASAAPAAHHPPVAQPASAMTSAPAGATAGTITSARASADPDLEYAPEDVNLPSPSVTPSRAAAAPAIAAPSRPATPPQATPPPATPPRPAPVVAPAAAPRPVERLTTPGPAAPAAEDALQTNTLAELYLKQGLVERAMDVYRAMLRVDASNDRARRRLAELEGTVAAGASPFASQPIVPEPERPAPSAVASVPRRAAILRLEGWLERIAAERPRGARGAER